MTATRKFNFAGPTRLYTEAKIEAAHADVSLTTFCVRAVRDYVETCRTKREAVMKREAMATAQSAK
jgi:hypothetical protein